MKKRPVLVRWEDACFHMGAYRGTVMRTSVGFLVGHGKKVVHLAQTHDRHATQEILSIPRAYVRRIERLEVS